MHTNMHGIVLKVSGNLCIIGPQSQAEFHGLMWTKWRNAILCCCVKRELKQDTTTMVKKQTNGNA